MDTRHLVLVLILFGQVYPTTATVDILSLVALTVAVRLEVIGVQLNLLVRRVSTHL